MSKELHPYLKFFDSSRAWKYLIVGTFPPNTETRAGKRSLTDYFYGNRGSLWRIIEDIYPECDFHSGSREKIKDRIMKWQKDYSVGITDTISECDRSEMTSSDDTDLNVDWEGYNHPLKEYIPANLTSISKVLFTSSRGCNSAYETFKIIMGPDLAKVRSKLVIDLPSPSGSANTSFFNCNVDETLGLERDFYLYLVAHKKYLLSAFRTRWDQKREKLKLPMGSRKGVVVNSAPKDCVKDYKIWKYGQALPKPVTLKPASLA